MGGPRRSQLPRPQAYPSIQPRFQRASRHLPPPTWKLSIASGWQRKDFFTGSVIPLKLPVSKLLAGAIGEKKFQAPLPKRLSVPFSLQQFFPDVITPLAPQPESKSVHLALHSVTFFCLSWRHVPMPPPKTDFRHLFFAKGPV